MYFRKLSDRAVANTDRGWLHIVVTHFLGTNRVNLLPDEKEALKQFLTEEPGRPDLADAIVMGFLKGKKDRERFERYILERGLTPEGFEYWSDLAAERISTLLPTSTIEGLR